MSLEAYSKTKRRVFEAAVELFANRSFESVSMEDIATALGRKKPSIYNHFSSKQEILDIALAFFCEHFFDMRQPVEAFAPMLRKKSLLDIIQAINFRFPPKYDLLLQRILRIIHQRKYFDPQAQAIFQEIVIDRSMQYGQEILDFIVAQGRTAPFDTRSYSMVLNYTRQGTYTRWVLRPTDEHYLQLLAEETQLFRYSLLPITDHGPEYTQT